MWWLVPACDQGGKPSSVALHPWEQIRGTAGEDLGTGVAGAVTEGDGVQGHRAGAVGPRGLPTEQLEPFICWVLGGGGATWGPRTAVGQHYCHESGSGVCASRVSALVTLRGRDQLGPQGRAGRRMPCSRSSQDGVTPRLPKCDELETCLSPPLLSARSASLGGPAHRRGPLHVHLQVHAV